MQINDIKYIFEINVVFCFYKNVAAQKLIQDELKICEIIELTLNLNIYRYTYTIKIYNYKFTICDKKSSISV